MKNKKRKGRKPMNKGKYPYGSDGVRERDLFKSPLNVLSDFQTDKDKAYAESNAEEWQAAIGLMGSMLEGITGSLGQNIQTEGEGKDFLSNIMNTKAKGSEGISGILGGPEDLSKYMTFGMGGEIDPVIKENKNNLIVPDDYFTKSGIDIGNDVFMNLTRDGRMDLYKRILAKKKNPTKMELGYLKTYSDLEMQSVLEDVNTVDPIKAAFGLKVPPEEQIVSDDYFEQLGIDINSDIFTNLSKGSRGDLFKRLLEGKEKPSGEELGYLQQYTDFSMKNILKDVEKADPLQQFPMGGKVPVEVEGGEVAKMPGGGVMEFNGPTHENGGIDANLPPGTEIFSERLKIGGKSLAEFEKSRIKSEKKLLKQLETNPTDKINKETFERLQNNNELERQKHMKYQEMMKKLSTLAGNVALTDGKEVAAFGDMSLGNTKFTDLLQDINISDFGDEISMAGNIFSAFQPMRLTKRVRAGDTPNINFYKDFGKETLATIEDMKGTVAGKEEEALKNLERSRISQTTKNRETARGINQMRAFDIAGQASSNREQSNIKALFSQQMLEILNKEAAAEAQRDQFVAAGERDKVISDKQDRDNYYSQLAQDTATLGEGIQNIGKDLNAIKSNRMAQDLINQLSQYGFKFENGKLIKSKV